VHIRAAAPLYVPRDANDAALKDAQAEMQRRLDEVRVFAENDAGIVSSYVAPQPVG